MTTRMKSQQLTRLACSSRTVPRARLLNADGQGMKGDAIGNAQHAAAVEWYLYYCRIDDSHVVHGTRNKGLRGPCVCVCVCVCPDGCTLTFCGEKTMLDSFTVVSATAGRLRCRVKLRGR